MQTPGTHEVPGRPEPNPMSWRKPTPDQEVALDSLAPVWTHCYEQLGRVVPRGPYRTLAIRKLQEARMWANAAIIFDGGRPE